MPDKDPLNITGQVVAEKYRIEYLAGEGGFAVVYVAEHTIWKQPVAVKFFSGLSQAPAEYREELLQQFFQEGALLTELSSQTAGIVQARDVGAYTTPTGQWLPFMVLEWLDGTPLDAVLAEDQRQGQPWTEGDVVGFLRRILPILDVAHRRGVTHRDIKPANIFMMGSDARAADTPCKLLDFGVAKIVSEHAKVSAALAKTGVAITSFTPRYGAPEQFTRSYGATGPWTDVYSVALLACEMLTGRPALEGEDLIQFGFSSANPTRRPTPRFLGAMVSDHFEVVFAKALAIRPEDRFQHAGEFLEGVGRGPSPPAQAGPLASLQLAPTVLVRIDERPMAPAPAPATPDLPSAQPEPPSPAPAPAQPAPAPAKYAPAPSPTVARSESAPRKENASSLGSWIFFLIVLVGAFVAYSMTDVRGAKQVRAFFAPVVRLVRKEVAQQLPTLREKTRQVMDNAAVMLTGAAPACPPGTRLGPSVPAHSPEAHTGAGEHGPAERICVDEHPVSEKDYATCAVCEQPKIARAKSAGAKGARAKGKLRKHLEFCIDGKAPTASPIRCVAWKQAEIYCAALAARLPTEAELHALPPALTRAPMEWTSATPEADRETRIPFRCAHDQ